MNRWHGALLAVLLTPAGPGHAAGQDASSALEARALVLVNEARAAAGVAPLLPDPVLARVAREQAHRMRDRGFTGHGAPSFAHGTPEARLALAGVADAVWGENVGNYGSSRPGAGPAELLATLQTRLLESPPHRRNCLDPRLTHIGIGLALGAAAADADSRVLLPTVWMAQEFSRQDLRFARTGASLTPDGLAIHFSGILGATAGPLRLAVTGPRGKPWTVPVAVRAGRFSAAATLPAATGTWEATFFAPAPVSGTSAVARFLVDTGARPAEAIRPAPPAQE